MLKICNWNLFFFLKDIPGRRTDSSLLRAGSTLDTMKADYRIQMLTPTAGLCSPALGEDNRQPWPFKAGNETGKFL